MIDWNDVVEAEKTIGDTKWFTEARFGMFIHWGLYALGARHEWMKSAERKTNEEYEKYFEHFEPDLYDPIRWAELAEKAGMRYFVITTKHHEGFCLWDTAFTDYKATNTPIGRDLLTPMVDAFRTKGLKVGFYHSLLDWHHPSYTLDQHHPNRDRAEEKEMDKERKLSNYVDYLHNQTRELLTQFGQVDILWYDFSVRANEMFSGKGKDVWRSEELVKLVRSLQPKIILNDRLEINQDLKTPEQFQPASHVTVNGKPVVWEACHTFSGSWGYFRDESSWKTVPQLVQILIDCVSKGGNLLLNVGPNGRGEIDDRAVERLEGMGKWMRLHSRSIYGCGAAPRGLKVPTDCRYTFNRSKRRLYVHLFAPGRHVTLPGLAGEIAYAQLLNDASELTMAESIPEFEFGDGIEGQESQRDLVITLPTPPPDVAVPVIELFLK